MTISTTMAVGAAGQAASAAASAHTARISYCKTLLASFNAQIAPVSELHEFAECIQTLYPSEISGEVAIFLKALFAIALVGMIVGALRELLDGGSLIDAVMGGVLWFITAPDVTVFVVGLLYGIRWLFT